MRTCLVLTLGTVLTMSHTFANDIVLISGGPALRSHERFKPNTHDRYWANFVDSALARVKELREEFGPDDRVTWLVFRPGYVRRGAEEKQDYLKILEERGQRHGLTPIYFDDKDQLFRLLRRDGSPERPKIARLEYYGHSNKKCWMFDYSNRVDGGAIEPSWSTLMIWKKSQAPASHPMRFVSATAATRARSSPSVGG